MEILVLVLIAGLWAALMLPSVFEARRNAPTTSTRTFARSTAVLASVATASAQREAYTRRRVLARRRAILLSLAGAAVASLAVALWTGSIVWLMLTLVADALLAGYIALLLQIKQQRAAAAPVVALDAGSESGETEIPSVRVLVG